MASTRRADDETLLRHVDWVARQLLAGGVTTLEAKSGYGGTLTDELRLLRLLAAAQAHTRMQVVPTFLGAHVLPPGTTESDYVDLVVDEMFPAVVEQGVAQLCDLVCEVGEFSAASATRVLAAARRHGLPARVHADASSPSDGWATSVAGGAIGVDHLTYTPADAVRDVGPTDTIAVLLPLAELAYLDPVSAPARAFVDTEVPVAIAGDYCSAVRATSLLSAVAVATSRFRLTPAEALVGATLNAAYAVGRGHDRGSLDVGKRGDLAVIDIGHPDLLGVSVGTVPVRDVVIGGTTAYRRLAQSWTPTTPPREAIAC
jgi:imidazolonepropionase